MALQTQAPCASSQEGQSGLHPRCSFLLLSVSPLRCLRPRRLQSGAWQSQLSSCRKSRCRGVKVYALDAAMPFDFEHKATQNLKKERTLKIAVIGFGTFGQFLAKRLVLAGHQVSATSRGNYSKEAQKLGVAFLRDSNDLCEEHPDVVILASSILSTRDVLKTLPVQRLRRSTLFVDVLSVKLFPKQLMLAELPQEVDILCTHPMFGPDSGKGSWKDLNFMYEKVRIGSSSERQRRLNNFLKFFEEEGCAMVEMSCEEHDRHAASTQFITHTVGRVLGHMKPSSTPIDTRGYQSLLNLVDNTTHDSFELYYGLFMYNPNATEELKRLEAAFNHVRQGLFSRLHDVVRDQIFVADSSLQLTEDVAANPPPQATATEGFGTENSEMSSTNGNGVHASRESPNSNETEVSTVRKHGNKT